MADIVLGPRHVAAAGLCIGCGGCAKTGGGLEFNRHGQLAPLGEWSAGTNESFARICPFSPEAASEDEIAAEHFAGACHQDALIGRYEDAYVGHVVEDHFRADGSSGGMVTWVAIELLRRGLIDAVAHVAATDPHRDGRFFAYRISRSADAIRAGAKSRYYPVELSRILAEIRKVPGRYAVIGVPCFIKAVNLLRREEPLLAERIVYTLGLFCGHMKSARFVESFAWQLGVPLEQVEAVDYRLKNPGRPANWYTANLTLADGSARSRDWWHLADGDWGAGFFQHTACNYCDDVVAETADISFGDAWIEPYSSDGRGTNVVIARSALLNAILRDGIRQDQLSLTSVDASFVAETQAAGLRQRREGLAYRLRIAPPRLPLRKRVPPAAQGLPLRRRLVYRARLAIAAWSHRIFAAARRTNRPWVYLAWARLTLRLYRRIAYPGAR